MGATEPGRRVLESWARMLGAQQEARRVHAPGVGTKHLLIATYADPGVRRRMSEIGADMRDVQARVGHPVPLSGTVARGGAAPSVVVLSDGAVRVLDVLLTTVGNDPLLAGRADPGRPRDPRVTSALLRRLAVELLRDPGHGTARAILEDLTGGQVDPGTRRGAVLVRELLGGAPEVDPGLGVPLSRPDLA